MSKIFKTSYQPNTRLQNLESAWFIRVTTPTDQSRETPRIGTRSAAKHQNTEPFKFVPLWNYRSCCSIWRVTFPRFSPVYWFFKRRDNWPLPNRSIGDTRQIPRLRNDNRPETAESAKKREAWLTRVFVLERRSREKVWGSKCRSFVRASVSAAASSKSLAKQ